MPTTVLSTRCSCIPAPIPMLAYAPGISAYAGCKTLSLLDQGRYTDDVRANALSFQWH